MGFKGILTFPAIKQMNRRLSVWLLSKVDAMTRDIVISENKVLPMSKDDISLVFGIPNKGNRISGLGMPTKKTVSKITTEYLGMGLKDNRSIKYTQDVEERDYNNGMTPHEEDTFKASFIVYIVSTLLAPGAKFDYISVEYWNAIKDPSLIGNFDWCEYVMEKLLDSAVKLKADMEMGTKVPNITGCTLFLQIFYLDSLELGVLKLEHNVFPRIHSFDAEKIKYMIRSDTVMVSNNGTECSYGRSKLRSASECCYMWSIPKRSSTRATTISKTIKLWNATITLAQALRVPVEAAGPLFHGVAELQESIKIGAPIDFLWILSAILHIIEPYRQGYRYRNGNECRKLGQASNTIGQASSSNASDVDTLDLAHPPSLGNIVGDAGHWEWCNQSSNEVYMYRCHCSRLKTNVTVQPSNPLPANCAINTIQDSTSVARTAVSKYYLCGRIEKTTHATTCTAQANHNAQQTKVINRTDIDVALTIPTPWDMRLHIENATVRAMEIWDYLHNNYDSEFNSREPLVAHHIPKYIEVLAISMRDQVLGKSEMEMDLFDAILRHLKQCDDAVSHRASLQTWRHYVESDFLESLLAGCFDAGDPSIRSQFLGEHITHDIRGCKMIFYPAILEHRWICYIWNISKNEIEVFDPARNESTHEEAIMWHRDIVTKLKEAMDTISTTFFPGWHLQMKDASVRLLETDPSLHSRIYRSGVICADFCQRYDGNGTHTLITETKMAG